MIAPSGRCASIACQGSKDSCSTSVAISRPVVDSGSCLGSVSLPRSTHGPDQATDVQLSQEEVGYLSGVSRQRVNQALQVLVKANLVRVEYGRIRILDLAGLGSFMG